MLFQTVFRSFRTIFSSHLLSLFLKTTFITIAVFSVFMIALTAFTIQLHLFGEGSEATFANIGVGIVSFAISWLLLPTLVPLIAAFFQETIANRIESVEYPEYSPPAIQRPLAKELWEDSKFVLFLILINILMLPTFILGIGAIAYFFVNSYFVGREFFETAAARHVGREAAKELRKQNSMLVLFGGSAIVVLSITPLLNFTAPFIGVALMVHLFHSMHKPVEILPPR